MSADRSNARRAADALATAHVTAKTAANAIGQHRWRSVYKLPYSSHIGDLHDLALALQDIHCITRQLAELVRYLGDDIRAHYAAEGLAPDGDPWPKAVTDEAASAWTDLNKLRRQLHAIRTDSPIRALLTMRDHVRATRDNNR